MNRTRLVCLAAVSPALLMSGCMLHGQAAGPAAMFQGEWSLDKSFGVTPPTAWTMKVQSTGAQITVRSHWEEPTNGQYGLTLLGLTIPEFVIDTNGKDQAAQVGPFVLHYASTWENGKLVTHWSTSEYTGQSFQGTWTRAVTKDNRSQTLDVEATSSGGQLSRARLIFRRM